MIRIGQGWDIHTLVSGRPLLLGGVTIPHDKGESGHSDGDVLMHAITDAILGAVAAGDIGTHFPPSDPRYKDASSREFLLFAADTARGKGFAIMNIDSTIVLERPKIAPYIVCIRENLADILAVPADHISVKAKTNEGTGAVGEGNAVEAQAVVLLRGTENGLQGDTWL